jgi:fumarylpyruvate hydrolase
MTDYLFAPAPVTSLAIAGRNERFPVRRIFCVGRNYAAHAREMGADPEREAPFFFCKPSDGVFDVADGRVGEFPYPAMTADCHHELELVVALHSGGSDIALADASKHVFGYAVGLEMTRRDLQNQAKKKGHPWEAGKAFDASAPVGPIVPLAVTGALSRGAVTLAVNGQPRQAGDLSDLIWSVDETIAALSRLFRLQAGDLIFTGTPEGVGPVVRGDLMEAHIDGVGDLRVRVV